MRALVIPVVATLIAMPALAKPKAPSVAQLQALVKKLTVERDELKDRLAATESFQQDIAKANKSRDLARAEADGLRKDLEQLRASMSENQSGAEALMQDVRKLKAETASLQAENASLKKELEAANAKLQGQVAEGTLVNLTQEITPARPINLLRLTPHRKKVDRGAVVVNVLVSEKGEVLDTRLLQGLPGEGEWVQKANESCMDAAKRLIFDPAKAADGKTPVKVWQGVAFYLD